MPSRRWSRSVRWRTQRVHRPEHDLLLRLAHDRVTHLHLLGEVSLPGEVGGVGLDLVPFHSFPTLGAEIGGDVVDERLERLRQIVQLPFLGMLAGGELGDQASSLLFDHPLHRQPQGRLGEDPFALVVDPVALLVHHLVVTQHVLADVEVVALHLGLRVLDGAVHQPGLDGLVVVHPQPRHEAADAVAAEAPHELVLQAQVETAAAGVAQTAGAAAELVVDAPGLVPLGAHDAETAQAPHLFLGPLGLVPFGREHLGPALLRKARHRVPAVLEHVDRGVPVDLAECREVELLLAQQLAGRPFRVAAQEDVDATASHVGGDGHGAGPARLGDDGGLALVVLGVEHLVLDAAARAACC